MPGGATRASVSIVIEHDKDNDIHERFGEVERALADLGQQGRVVVCCPDDVVDVVDVNASFIFKGTTEEALREAEEDRVITLAGHEPDPYGRIVALWEERDRGDIVVASLSSDDRGTRPKDLASEFKRLSSRLTARLLTLDVLDICSRTRLYKKAVIDDLVNIGCDLDDSIGLLVHATVRGWKIREIQRPFWPEHGSFPDVKRPTLHALHRYWKARNGIHDADYDMRAFNSRIFVQRKWQQRRQELTTEFVKPFLGQRILNVGCGSARINLDLPGAFGVDVLHPKLRYLSRYGVNHLAVASVYQLPFPDASFDCVICAEVIEHIPREGEPIRELVRVIAPGGRLILSTPNYGTSVWPTIEKLYGWVQPSGYADEHVTHYTEESLKADLESYGMHCVEMSKLYGAVLIGAFERD